MPVKPTLLLIEDDPAVGTAMVKFLHANEYVAVLCRTGVEALHAATTLRPDAVITDVHLPDINGLVLSRQLRDTFGPDTPIIVLSGDTSTETIKSLSFVGATFFLSKPVNLDLLKERLAEYLTATPRGC